MPRVPSFFAPYRAAVLAFATVATTLSRAQAPLSEADLKAALVFNFARYVEWPEQAFASREAPITICVLGRDRLGAAFAALDGRKLQSRAARVRTGVATNDMRGCHVVFVGDLAERQYAGVVRSLAGQPVLTIGEAENFIDSGGAIGIVEGEQRLQFEVNRNALEQAHLKVSSQLLKLARAVVGQGGGV